MKEQLVTFETAKLAKEKGFIHMKANCYGDNMCYQLPEGELINALKGNTVAGYILAPTQSLLQKWLREKHSIHIEILLSDESPYNTLYYRVMEIGKYFTLSHSGFYSKTYEETLEKGLQEALKLID